MKNELQIFETSDKGTWFNSLNHHFHKQTAHKQFEWFGTDSENRFNSKSGYSKDCILYTFNSNGYRCDELVENCDTLFLGCSYTMGVGLNLQDTWAKIVSNSMKDKHFINLAYQGGSFSYFIRTLTKTLKFLKPKKLILLFPYNWRFELAEKDMLNVWTASGVHSGLFEFRKKERLAAYELFRGQEQEEFEILKNLQVINLLCELVGAKFYHTHWIYSKDLIPTDYFKEEVSSMGTYIKTSSLNFIPRREKLETLARDSTHPGIQHNINFAHEILQKL